MSKINNITIICLSIILLAACAPSAIKIQEAIAQTQSVWTPIQTHTAFPTYTPPPTIAIEVTRIVMVTPTYTFTPLYTPTITLTPTITALPTNTPNTTQTAQAQLIARLRADKGDGFYLVNLDIAPGVWRSTGTGDSCYWATTSKTGGINNNHFGMVGGTAYISPSDFQVEFTRCGIWVYLSSP